MQGRQSISAEEGGEEIITCCDKYGPQTQKLALGDDYFASFSYRSIITYRNVIDAPSCRSIICYSDCTGSPLLPQQDAAAHLTPTGWLEKREGVDVARYAAFMLQVERLGT